MTVSSYIKTMLAPDEHFALLPTGELVADARTMGLIVHYRDWLTVLLAAGYLELDFTEEELPDQRARRAERKGPESGRTRG